ncbi:MAG: outer membrane beta-barrel protein [Bacteroidetes bacterium]|nr:outer membrane beta-barrel protein [Bacteroidota bacterium]
MLNEQNDMNDELFRRAAENYPLKTDSANWDDLRARMETAAPEDNQPEPARRKKYRWLLLLLLLIPFAILENRFHFSEQFFAAKEAGPAQSKSGASESAATTTPQKDDQQPTMQEGVKETGQQTPGTGKQEQADLAATGKGSSAENSTVGADDKTATETKPASVPVQQDSKKINPGNENGGTKPTVKRHTQKQQANLNITPGAVADDETATASDKKSSAGKKMQVTGAADEVNPQNKHAAARKSIAKRTKQKQKVNIQAGSVAEDESATTKKEKVVNNVNEQEPVKETLVINESVKKEDSAAQKKPEEKAIVKEGPKKEPAIQDSSVAKKDKEKQPFRRFFYAGLVVAPDFSMIKMQSVKRVGLDFGLVFGYRFSKRFSVDAGLLYDKKYYETDGKYYNPKNVTLPANTKYGNVKGGCNMWELPINITYHFWQKPKSGWFASLGTSSYFMKKEAYDYDVIYSPTYTHHYSKSYKSKETAAFAVVNMGVGYTHRLGKIADIRIEPYVRLPIRKMGGGNMPIQSAGIFIGLTRSFF